MSDQPETRAMQASDYDTIWKLLEAGTPEKAVLAVYPIKPETLKKRMAADRPGLWRKYKQLTTSTRVVADDKQRAAAVVTATMQALKMDVLEFTAHDFAIMADRARKQQAEKLSDPNKVLTPVALPDAKGIKSLLSAVGMFPDSGLQSGSNTSVTVNTVNHAQTMRRGDNSNILASDDELADAVVEVESEVLE